MKLHRKIGKRGFTVAELLIVVAIIAILIGIGFTFVDPHELTYVEANRNAESIATAAQNRLTALRNAGEIDYLQQMGKSVAEYTSSSEQKNGGYRYIFSHDAENKKNPEMTYILPYGSIDPELTKGYYALCIQSDTGMVQEAYYSADINFATLDMNAIKEQSYRKNRLIGFYQGIVDDAEIAFAQLPTPQLTINNYENLELYIYLPEVQELVDLNKQLAIRVSLADEDGKAYDNLTLDDTAIYRTYTYADKDNKDSIHEVDQATAGITMGQTYRLILDTPAIKISNGYTKEANKIYEEVKGIADVDKPPTGKFEAWANLTAAYRKNTAKENGGIFKLGDNVQITVTVFCLYDDEAAQKTTDCIDPTYMPRSGSVKFNGWFDSYDGSSSVNIACGRHLQNLGLLTELYSDLEKYLPTNEDGSYDYSLASRGKGYYYTDDGDHHSNKYNYRNYVQDDIRKANQVKAIDFDSDAWTYYNGTDYLPIPFDPINVTHASGSFYYYGNYLTIKHLHVDAPFYAGLFGYAYSENLYDILLVNPYVRSSITAYAAEVYEVGVGALIGSSRNSGEIKNCQVYMEEENGEYNKNYRIIGDQYVGGLIGFCEDENIEVCSASVYTGSNPEAATLSNYVGGLIGCITGDSDIERCYAASNLTGVHVGGLVGIVMQDSDDSGDDYDIHSCYTAGHIERATVSAAGLIGYIDEQGGYGKSALRAYQNYCVVIYGTGSGNSYTWKSTRSDGTSTPIYGTFEGDGFKWLYSDSGYLTGNIGSTYSFLGSNFVSDNENYYIPQKGITYSDSDYFTSMKDISDNFLGKLNDITNDPLSIKDAATTLNKNLSDLKSAFTNALNGSSEFKPSDFTDGQTIVSKANSVLNSLKSLVQDQSFLDSITAEQAKEFQTNVNTFLQAAKDLQANLADEKNNGNKVGYEIYTALQTSTEKIERSLTALEASFDNTSAIQTAISGSRDQLRYAKQLDTLEEMKNLMERIIYELDSETATYEYEDPEDPNKTKKGTYRDGGYYSSSEANISGYVYLDIGDCKIRGVPATNSIKFTLIEAMKAIYGKDSCTDTNGEKYDFSNNENATNGATKAIAGGLDSAHKETNNTFMYYYENLKSALSKMIDGTATDPEKAMVDRMLGTTNGVGNADCYKNGTLYTNFYDRLLYRGIDKAKDYFEHSEDKIGEETYRYFRDRLVECFKGYLGTMTANVRSVKESLQTKKEYIMTEMIKDIDLVITVAKKWSDSTPMGPYKDKILSYAQYLKKYLEKVQEKVKGLRETKLVEKTETTPEHLEDQAPDTLLQDLKEMIKSEQIFELEDKDGDVVSNGKEILDLDGRPIYGVADFFNFFYEIFNSDYYYSVKNGNWEKSTKDKGGKIIKNLEDYTLKATDKTRNGIYVYEYIVSEKLTSGDEKGMRGIRDMLNQWRSFLNVLDAQYYSGVEGAMDELDYMCKLKNNDKANNDDIKRAIANCRDEITDCLGQEWENHDSGHRIYSSIELRRIVRNMNVSKTSRTENDDFVINYGGYNQPTIYGKDDNTGRKEMFSKTEQHYVDQDNGVYNNVFPYNENKYTRYYPFPMIEATKTATGEKKQATDMLFHYGDWLTDDLWADDCTLSGKTHKYHFVETSELASVVQDAIDALNIIKQFSEDGKKADGTDSGKPDSGFWNRDDGMGPYKKYVDDQVDDALAALGELSSAIETYETALKAYEENNTEENKKALQTAIETVQKCLSDYIPNSAYSEYKELYNMFDTDKIPSIPIPEGNVQPENSIKDTVDSINTNYDTSSNGMRYLRTLLGLSLNALENMRENTFSRNESGTVYEANLLNAKKSLELIKVLSDSSSSYWKGKGGMSSYKATVDSMVGTAMDSLNDLLKEVRNYVTAYRSDPSADHSALKTDLESAYTTAKNDYNNLWYYFDNDVKTVVDNVIDSKGVIKDKGTDSTDTNNSHYGMRDIRELLGGWNGSLFSKYTDIPDSSSTYTDIPEYNPQSLYDELE